MSSEYKVPGQSGLVLAEELLWEKGRKGRSGASIPASKVPSAKLPAGLEGPGPDWPDLAEHQVARHYTRLSTWNFGVDTGTYPLGSCTMKYNPKINEELAGLPGFAKAHPLLPSEAVQGELQIIHELERFLAEIVGLEAASLQPGAGAHGELCGMLLIAAHHRHNKQKRTKVLMPDTAHGTNPASAAMCGFSEIKVPLGPKGYLEYATVEKLMNDEVAGLMVTNPNTLGLFETELVKINEMIHRRGGLVYGDGANLNAVMGRADLGKLGIDVVHYNTHKTLSTPHGGGGPGAGPVAVGKTLTPYLPGPRVVRKEDGGYEWNEDLPLSIGRMHAFHGQFRVLVRAYAYVLTMGAMLKDASELAVLNANYVKEKLKDLYDLPFPQHCMHECVFTNALQEPGKISTLDIAKRLIDLGFHPPTIYFPLVVHSAIMIEPTETESKEELDAFIAGMRQVALEARNTPDLLREAPTRTVRRRLDDVAAARRPVLTGDMK
ncbi:MAG: aminomethyl-transferring glycine dehydrogenase subunit GcvPB [Deltaproteobacteria bacterium]|jgi:glycine dehydrogenase subunit 2|nr:aminomethyl-transferring glycine dehydrogenase subunit GcvPB [Deltaproteobacteria bacterium]